MLVSELIAKLSKLDPNSNIEVTRGTLSSVKVALPVATRKSAVPQLGEDTSAMSDADVFAYYKSTAMLGDADFFICNVSSATAEQRVAMIVLRDALTARKASPKDKAEYMRIVASWRQSQLDAEHLAKAA